MNIIITDAGTPVGCCLKEHLRDDHKIYSFNTYEINILNKAEIKKFVQYFKPDILINTTSMDDMILCEKDESSAYSINTIACSNTAYICSLLNIPILYFSTAYIFNGNKQTPYLETDEGNPLNVYGKTKLAGEKLIRTLCQKFFIIRTSWLFGYGHYNITDVVLMGKEGSPTYIPDLCDAVCKIISSSLYGIYNCVNSKPAYKSFFINKSPKCSVIKKDHPKFNIRIPEYTVLSTDKIKNYFNIEMPDWNERIKNGE